MKCMADLCVIPIGEGVSVADEVAQCQRILQRFPIEIRMHAYGTNLYGEWDDVFAAIKACHAGLHDGGVTRLSSTIKVVRGSYGSTVLSLLQNPGSSLAIPSACEVITRSKCPSMPV